MDPIKVPKILDVARCVNDPAFLDMVAHSIGK
jgi:hypothetical protein